MKKKSVSTCQFSVLYFQQYTEQLCSLCRLPPYGIPQTCSLERSTFLKIIFLQFFLTQYIFYHSLSPHSTTTRFLLASSAQNSWLRQLSPYSLCLSTHHFNEAGLIPDRGSNEQENTSWIVLGGWGGRGISEGLLWLLWLLFSLLHF